MSIRNEITKTIRACAKKRKGEGHFESIGLERAISLARAARKTFPVHEGDEVKLLETTYHGDPGTWVLERYNGGYDLNFIFNTGPFTSRSQGRYRRRKRS